MRGKFAKLGLIILTFVYLLIPVQASGIVLTPPKFEFTLDPGQEINEVIKLTNDNATDLILNSEVQDFVASGETGQPSFVAPADNKTGLSLANWINVNNGEQITIKSGEKKEIPFTIKVPQDAEPGGKYGTIFFYPPSAGGQVAVVQKIGSLVLVKVSGEIIEDGELLTFETYYDYEKQMKSDEKNILEDKMAPENTNFFTKFLLNIENKQREKQLAKQGKPQFFYEKLPINFAVRYENTGNVHLKPQGKIEIYNTFGKLVKPAGVMSLLSDGGVEQSKEIVDYVPVNDTKGNVLAKSIRRFETIWQGEPYWYKEEDGSKVVKYKGFPIGYYTAKLTLTGANKKEINSEIKFLVFPWKEIGGGLLGLIIILFLFIKYRKWSHRRLETQFRKRMEAEKNKKESENDEDEIDDNKGKSKEKKHKNKS